MSVFLTSAVCYLYVDFQDCLALDRQLVPSSLGKTVSHSQNSLVVCSSLYRFESCALSPVHLGMSIAVFLVQFMFRQSRW